MEGSGVLGRRQLRSVYLVTFRGIYSRAFLKKGRILVNSEGTMK